MKCSECGCRELLEDRFGRLRYYCGYDLPDTRPCELNGDHWEKEDDEDLDYTCSSAGDYSPSNPWDAPGMSVRDFI